MSTRALCPVCVDDEDIEVVEVLADGRRRVEHRCGQSWVHGVAPPAQPTRFGFDELRSLFPTPADVDPAWRERAEGLKAEFLRRSPGVDPVVADYWDRYARVFSEEGLWSCDPAELKRFANDPTGAGIGNMSVFNTAWNQMGEVEAADATRSTIDYLLRGPAGTPLEDRLQELLAGARTFSMPGFKEALLTKVLCVVRPDRFVPILTYTSDAGGKREIARLVYGLELPAPETVNWTRGRLILWSNDVLHALAGPGFVNQQHVASFLWWAKDQPGRPDQPT